MALSVSVIQRSSLMNYFTDLGPKKVKNGVKPPFFFPSFYPTAEPSPRLLFYVSLTRKHTEVFHLEMTDK